MRRSQIQSTKTARKTPGRPFAKGYDPRRGVGEPGRSGRPKAAIRQWCREQLLDPDVQAAISAVVRDPKAPNFASTLKLLFHYAVGAPVQRVELRGLPAVAARMEAMSEGELLRLAEASDAELVRLLPSGEEVEPDE